MIAGLWGAASSSNNSSNPPNAAKQASPNGDVTVTEAPEEPSDPAPEAATPDADIADTGLEGLGLPPPLNEQAPPSQPASENAPASKATLKRPPISRGTSASIAPPLQPPPPAPGAPQQATDSLTLDQLKRLVADFPVRNEPTIYAYTYSETASFEEEIDEWFAYGTAEYTRLNRCKIQFGTRWKSYSQKSWSEESWERKKEFVRRELDVLSGKKGEQSRRKSVQRLMHILLGVWDESAGQGKALSLVIDHEEHKREGEPQIRSQATKSQLEALKDGVKLITEVGGVKGVYDALRTILDGVREDDYREAREATIPDEVDNIMTVMYIIVEVTRCYPSQFSATQFALASLQPSLLTYLLTTLATLRWDDTPSLPQTHLFSLFCKSLLLLMGSLSQVETVKTAVAESLQQTDRRDELITASPLDYHIFRQEITSKYPAYIPPAPLLPLDTDDTTILPGLHKKEPGYDQGGVVVLPMAASSGSILHQPVHIATPAPSPPPSPPVGGKAGKKQNYQTNQNFPFMYPPLDSSSSSAGGKGGAGLQHDLVGKKWEGSEIPASILEAGELFANRTKMTRAMRQLWDEREAFLKFERGWDGEEAKDDLDEDLDVDEFKLEEVLMKRLEKLGREDDEADNPKQQKLEIDTGPRPVDDEVKQRLETVEEFFIAALPHLQSLIIVLLKAILANVTSLITAPLPGQATAEGLQSAYQSEVNLRVGVPGAQRARPDQPVPLPQTNGNGYDVTALPEADLEALRQREISLKAVSGILLTLLKWFKVSHVLKFEYLTQLLLDANYLPLVLKFFAHTDVDKLVDTDCERQEKSFWGWCNRNAKKLDSPRKANGPSIFSGMGMDGQAKENSQGKGVESETDEDEDEACPPPIKISRSSPRSSPLSGSSTNNGEAGAGAGRRPANMPPNPRTASAIHLPLRPSPNLDVDEEGNQIPSTNYSARNFTSSINLLRVMHKITDGKTHRLLLLVQYKSSAILKKALKVQEPQLRKYTLKLFKGQVPFCGRKWRQGNMRVITQVYLELRPQLREEWLAGGEVEGRVEESAVVEQAGRSIVGWGLGRRYKEVLYGERWDGDEDGTKRDWFRGEVERMVGGLGV